MPNLCTNIKGTKGGKVGEHRVARCNGRILNEFARMAHPGQEDNENKKRVLGTIR